MHTCNLHNVCHLHKKIQSPQKDTPPKSHTSQSPGVRRLLALVSSSYTSQNPKKSATASLAALAAYTLSTCSISAISLAPCVCMYTHTPVVVARMCGSVCRTPPLKKPTHLDTLLDALEHDVLLGAIAQHELPLKDLPKRTLPQYRLDRDVACRVANACVTSRSCSLATGCSGDDGWHSNRSWLGSCKASG